MTFQPGDWVIFHGFVCRVAYANADVVATRRRCDGHISISTPQALTSHQVPWIDDGLGCRPMKGYSP